MSNCVTERRFGRLTVSGAFLRGATQGQLEGLFGSLVCLHCEHHFIQDVFTLHCASAMFGRVGENEQTPEYTAELHQSDHGQELWTFVRHS